MRHCFCLDKSRDSSVKDFQKALVRNTCFSQQPTMNHTDSKRILAIFVGALSTLCVETTTCPDNQFQLPNSLCCLNCEKGWYVTRNCSKENEHHNGVSCKKCRICEDYKLITVSNCTQFTDTQCMDQPDSTLPAFSGELPQINLYGCSYVVVMVVALAVLVAVCFIRISKSDESDEGSAGEPFNTKDAEIV